MKIAMFYDAWDILGGGRIHVENICNQLIKNHDCSIDLFIRAIKTDDGILKQENENKFNGKLRIIRCGRPKNFFNFFERLISLFSILFIYIKYNKKEKYNIIHAHTYLPLLAGKMGSRISKVPIIITVHGSQIMDIGQKNIKYMIQKYLLTKIKYNKEICVGKNFLEYKNVNKVVNIGNGVNIEEFKGPLINNKKTKKLLFVGRLERTKGVDVLIDAIDYIVSTLHIKNFVLDIVGYGYDEDNYHHQVKKKGLKKYIKFHGVKKGKELVSFYKKSDIMIVPSRAEGFGIIILEAMASGIPVIATKSGGPEDIITNGVNGLLVTNHNTLLLAEKIASFIKGDIKNINDIINKGYITIKNKYTWENITAQIYEQYISLYHKKQ